jgi:hypothetical protein
MQKLLMFGVIALIAVAGETGLVLAADDDGSKIAITAPKDGATVGDTFDLKYDLVKGSKAAHAHVYLDGKYQKGFDGTFKGVDKGKHEIKVQAATSKHDLLAATQTITIEVK